ncbi:MAG: radical SAM family heme chaperone HemW [Gammaproteobacteria bacterium]|nr:radical SAM family heme chaperone HemW [Gammaproteobacteria bacterium]
MLSPPLSLYIHLPWCVRKCPYCDFNSHPALETVDYPGYTDALLDDLTGELPLVAGRTVETIFFGGGTPSLFPPGEIGRLIKGIESRLPCSKDLEVTLEANPGTADQDRFVGYREAGVNRLSIGVQSFNSQSLKMLERIHGPRQALDAIGRARAAGFENINLDLMFGLPGQGVEQALEDVCTALEHQPEHVSFYQLTVEPNTRFFSTPPTLPSDEAIWEMQCAGQEMLAAGGVAQYEISAFSRPRFQCRHNLNYWTFGDYLGIGAGAHGKVTHRRQSLMIERRWKMRSPSRYVASRGTARMVAGTHVLSDHDTQLEFMMNALRLRAGFTSSLFEERTGLSFSSLKERLQLAEERGFIKKDGDIIGCTELGRRYLNDLLALFV